VLSVLAVESELRAGQLVKVGCVALKLGRTIRAIWMAGRSAPTSAGRLVSIALQHWAVPNNRS
jgi:hypothetical protein